MEKRSPFLDYLDDFLRKDGRNFSHLAEITGLSQPSFSRIISAKQTVTPEFIDTITKKICNETEKKEVLLEYLNHRLYEIDPSLYGHAQLLSKNKVLKSSKHSNLSQLFELLDQYNKTNPQAAELLATGILNIINSFKESVPQTTTEFEVEQTQQDLSQAIRAGVQKAVEDKTTYKKGKHA